MPRMDGTGPQGNGPLTGRGLGRCNDGKSKNIGGNGIGFNRKRCDRLFLRRRNRGRFFNNSTDNDNN
ncbi:DUF5320 domain-containing protein [Vallitalea maricola]|uniref:Uncharacterized protein n=1 Tax=Vallitalea maricola TaxID=3074433 RepID=A0ACB5UF53_9FIRM|nr:hypothetical protein AN2V17_08160 [Vallitalea sp. AN17-2]